MNLYHDLNIAIKDDFSEIHAVMEIPKGGILKYEFDHELGAIKLDRVGRTPLAYNFNYGDLPQTWNKGDNDPLDVIILCRFPIAVGVVVPLRVIGGLKMIDDGEFDYKVVAVADDKYYDHVKDISDIPEMEKEDIHYFMKRYKDLHNKRVDLEGWDNKETAIKIIKDCHEEYKRKFNK